jgi:hypothetical protein
VLRTAGYATVEDLQGRGALSRSELTFLDGMLRLTNLGSLEDLLKEKTTMTKGVGAGGMRGRYERLVEEWKAGPQVMESEASGRAHPAFTRILGLGRDGVRFLLEDLRDGKPLPSAVHALIARHAGYDPVPADVISDGDPRKIVGHLIQWGYDQKRIRRPPVG